MAGKTKEESILPEDSSDSVAFGESELRVDFSSEELSSEARTFDPVPTAKYPVTITEYEVRKSKGESKPENKGKPYWNLRLRVNEGKHEGRLFFANVMLFKGAMYSYVQLA